LPTTHQVFGAFLEDAQYECIVAKPSLVRRKIAEENLIKTSSYLPQWFSISNQSWSEEPIMNSSSDEHFNPKGWSLRLRDYFVNPERHIHHLSAEQSRGGLKALS
jgi:hypothetical protein